MGVVTRNRGEKKIPPTQHKQSQHRRRRKNANFVALPFSSQRALGTLGSEAALVEPFLATLTEDLFVISVDVFWQINTFTALQGPILVGIAHGDLSVTEITEALDASPSGPRDIIAMERARRPVRRAGQFNNQLAGDRLNDGKAVRTRCKFLVPDGVPLNMYAVNRGSAALSVTDPIVEFNGTVYGRWLI